MPPATHHVRTMSSSEATAAQQSPVNAAALPPETSSSSTHSTRASKTTEDSFTHFIEPRTYVLIVLYTLIIIGGLYFLWTDDYARLLRMSSGTGPVVNYTSTTQQRMTLTSYLSQYFQQKEAAVGESLVPVPIVPIEISQPQQQQQQQETTAATQQQPTNVAASSPTAAASGDNNENSAHNSVAVASQINASKPSHPLADTRAQFAKVKPALQEAQKAFATAQPAMKTVSYVLAIFAITWLLMRTFMRRLLDVIVSYFNLESSSRFGVVSTLLRALAQDGKKRQVTRLISFVDESASSPVSSSSVASFSEAASLNAAAEAGYESAEEEEGSAPQTSAQVFSILQPIEGTSKPKKKKDKSTNYISSTVFDSSSPALVLGLSALYGALVYLSQKMQVWCLAIATVQLLLFHTGKSFWPLMIFTVFIAISFSLSEYSAWKADQRKNTRKVQLAQKAKGTTIERGKLRPGDIIELRIGEEVPADVIITGARLESEESRQHQHRRLIFFANEVQVTGENTPVRKIPFRHKIDRIEIRDLSKYKALVNGQLLVEEHSIAFASSKLESELKDLVVTGIVAWVGTETKSLNDENSQDGGIKRYRKATPFDDYTGKGFLLSIAVLLSISLLNATVAYFYADPALRKNFGTVFINHLMFLNMMVPQAMEQCRVWVSSSLSSHFRAKIRGCNRSNSLDVLAYVDRIVTDKTGTLTQNKMVARVLMVFRGAGEREEKHMRAPLELINEHDNGNEEDNLHMYHRDFFSQHDVQQEFERNAMAVFATTGQEPEERAIRRNLAAYASLGEYEPQDPQDPVPGIISYIRRQDNQERRLLILENFGFCRPLLSKSVLFEDEETKKKYIAVQAGGDDFWRLGKSMQTEVAARLEIWDERERHLPRFSGAPRCWSHGIKEVSEEQCQKLRDSWRKTWNTADREKREQDQIAILRDALEDMSLLSKTLMIDVYRVGVVEGIKILHKKGKQIIMCTGDSQSAATTIATQLGFPSNFVSISGETEDQLLESLEEASDQSQRTASTFLFDQRCMELLQHIEKREGGFYGDVYNELVRLLARRDPHKQGHRFMHYAVFYRATPGLKPFVVRLMQHRYVDNLIERIQQHQHYVLAMGDGANDINMFEQADATFGIMSGETKDVCDRAAFWSDEWYPCVKLLQQDGPEKAALLATMGKMVFAKHWMTAFALWADLLLHGFTLLPMDPIEPMLMLLYNAVAFSQIATHSAQDSLPNPSKMSKKKLMSMRAFTRWIFGAIVIGFVICWSVRWLFPSATDAEFGALVVMAKSFAITAFIMLSTNAYSSEKKKSAKSTAAATETQEDVLDALVAASTFTPQTPAAVMMTLASSATPVTPRGASMQANAAILSLQKRRRQQAIRSVVIGMLSLFGSIMFAIWAMQQQWLQDDRSMRLVALIAVLLIGGYPAKSFLRIMNKDMLHLLSELRRVMRMPVGDVMQMLVKFSHSEHGRIVPVLSFLFALKLSTSLPLIALMGISLVIIIVAFPVYFIVISRLGFVRALLDGRPQAVAFAAFAVGVYVGKAIDN